MRPEQFERSLGELIRQEPFQPFIVEFVDGRTLAINRPELVFGGGAASFFTPTYDLIEFACEDVQAIRPAVPEASA